MLASHWPIWGATALARLARAQLIGADGVEPQEGRRCFASCVVGQRNGEGTDHGDGADFCVDFGDINIATFVAAIAAGGVLVVTKPGAHAATWVAKSLHLISTRCPLCCPAASRRVGAARRVVIVRRKFDAVALTVAAGCARTCPLCECVSVSATETNTVQEPVLRFSAGFGQLLFADVKLTKLGGGGTVKLQLGG